VVRAHLPAKQCVAPADWTHQAPTQHQHQE
jgi:hypothetical protein